MISLNRLLRISFALAFLLVIIFLGCSEQPEKKNYLARVNDSYLYEEDLNNLDSLLKNSFSRNELIKRWVDKELLYQQAEKVGITDEEEFSRIINNSRRELASSVLINNYLAENLMKPNNTELKEFYDGHKNEFKAGENIYVFNSSSFASENAAVKFRTKVVETNWEKAVESLSDDNSLIEKPNRNVLSKAEIYPVQLLKLIQELNPGEVSIVLEENSSKYSIVQLIQIFREGAIPPLEIVADEVEARYVSEKREEVFNEYLKKLYSDNQIEIKEK